MPIKRQQTNHNLRKCQTKKIVLEPGHQIKQSSIPASDVATQELDIYEDLNTRERICITEAKLDMLIDEMIQFCRNDPSAVLIRTFMLKKGICSSQVFKWRQKYPKFAQAYEFAKGAVGERLFVGALTRSYDSGTVRTALPVFLDEFKEETERMARLRTEEKNAEATKTLNVYMTEARSPEEIEKDERSKQESKT